MAEVTLQELKIVYDHVKARFDKANGSKVSDPQGYSLTLAEYRKVKEVYEKAIDNIIGKL